MARRVLRSAGASAPELTRVVLPAEIRVVDEESRIIEICATSEAVDAHGTIFGYDASKDAFNRWAGNVREMHERKAVGRRVEVRPEDESKRIYTRLRISKGAEDTWQKVLDQTLDGASIGAANVTWEQRTINGKRVPYATHYDLVELSLVDVGSNPDTNGIQFVRDGVLDGELLAEESTADLERSAEPETSATATAETSASVAEPNLVRSDAGDVGSDDPAAEIAARALARGRAELAHPELAADSQASQTGASAKRARLAALGAPGYQATAAAADQSRADEAGPGAMYDADGDHDAPEDMCPEISEDGYSFKMHTHHHTGGWDDPSDHKMNVQHTHLNGVSHIHEFVLDHNHGGHEGLPNGHSHPHIHVADHGHYFRVADGAPIDARLVTADQLRLREWVSEKAFTAAGGVEGRGLSAEQFRVAAGVETRLEAEAAERAQGAFSRNPYGPADIGTPDTATERPTSEIAGEGGQPGAGNGGMGQLDGADLAADLPRDGNAPTAQGQVTPLSRDGQPVAGAGASGELPSDVSTTGVSDHHEPPDGYVELTDHERGLLASEVTRTALPELRTMVAAETERVTAARFDGVMALLGDVMSLVERIAAQPVGGGPVLHGGDLRGIEKTSALQAAGAGNDRESQLRALGGLAGRLRDPQVQVAVAAEMIRLQQEGAGYTPEQQAMPRAGGPRS